MATQEYLLKHIEASARYQDLPSRLKIVVSEEDWNKRYERGQTLTTTYELYCVVLVSKWMMTRMIVSHLNAE
jgi:hypothetical protein